MAPGYKTLLMIFYEEIYYHKKAISDNGYEKFGHDCRSKG